MDLNSLVLNNQMESEHYGIHEEMYFPVKSVGIFVILCFPWSRDTEHGKKNALSPYERQNPYW